MKNLKVLNAKILKNGKVRLCALTGAVVMLFSMTGCGNEEAQVSPTPNVVETPAPTPTPEPTPTPVVEEEVKLTAENFDDSVKEIIEANEEKDLYTKEDFVRSALLLVNLDELSDEDLITLGIADMNMQEELQNLLTYVSEVETHNLNCDKKEYISLTTLAYGKTDKEMLTTLEEDYWDLRDALDKEVEEDDKEKQEALEEEKTKTVAESVANVTEFVIGTGRLETSEGKYTRRNLSSGAGILSESYIQFIGAEAASSGYADAEVTSQIKTIDELTNGLFYINDIYTSNRIASCVEKANDKQLTKTNE